jgi:hypothetical protein
MVAFISHYALYVSILNVTYLRHAWSTRQIGRGIGTPRYTIVVSALALPICIIH